MSIGAGVGSLIGGAASGIGSIFGASQSSSAATKAAQIQAQAAEQAAQLQFQMFQQVQGNLSPWMYAGTQGLEGLMNLTGAYPGGNPLTRGTGQITAMPSTWGMYDEFNPTMADLAKTPGYQFNLEQGQRAVTNSAAARGLGTSGAALKGDGASANLTGYAGAVYGGGGGGGVSYNSGGNQAGVAGAAGVVTITEYIIA